MLVSAGNRVSSNTYIVISLWGTSIRSNAYLVQSATPCLHGRAAAHRREEETKRCSSLYSSSGGASRCRIRREFVPEKIVHAFKDILGDVMKAELCHTLKLRKRWQGDGRAACARVCICVCVNSAAKKDSSQTKTQVASLACGKAVAAKRKATGNMRRYQQVPLSPPPPRICSGIASNEGSRRHECRTSSLPPVWCPPVPRPPSLLVVVSRSSLSRDLPAAATVLEVCQKGGVEVQTKASRQCGGGRPR